MSFDKPLHPATVHWPLAFLTTAYGLDVLNVASPYLPSQLSSYLPFGAELSRISYYALSLGILTSFPAIVTGVAQAMQSIKSQGLYEADKKTLRPKVKVIVGHALANDVVVALSAYMWYQRREAGKMTYAPDTWMVGLSVILGVAILYSAHLGGVLVYNMGMGLSMAKGKGKAA